MWMITAAVAFGVFFGRTVRDALSAVFLTCVSVAVLHWLVSDGPASFQTTALGRRLLELMTFEAVPSLSGLLLVAVPMVLMTSLLGREQDRLKHWDEFGPRPRRRRRGHGRVRPEAC